MRIVALAVCGRSHPGRPCGSVRLQWVAFGGVSGFAELQGHQFCSREAWTKSDDRQFGLRLPSTLKSSQVFHDKEIFSRYSFLRCSNIIIMA